MAKTTKRKLKKALHFKLPQKTIEIENIPLKRIVYVSVVINIVVVVFVLIFQKYLPPVVPLYYSLAKSEAQLTDKIYLILPGVSAVIVTVANVFLSIFMENDYVKKALIVTGFVVTLLSAITTFKIAFLVGSI